MVMPWMSPMILKVWIKLKPCVDYEIDRRHEPDYYSQVRALAERCLSWREAHGMNTEVLAMPKLHLMHYSPARSAYEQ